MEQKARRLPAKVWIAYLVGGLAVTGGYYAVPAEGAGRVARVVLYCLVSMSAAVAVGYGVLSNRPNPRRSWLMLGLSQVIYATADIVFYVSHYLLGSTAYPSFADVLYLAHYPLVVVGLTLLIRHRTPGRDLPGLLDAAMFAVSAALLSWLFLIGPQARFDAPLLQRVVSVAYPVMDLAMLAVALRLILGAGWRPAAFYLLSGNLLAIFGADTVYVVQQLAGDYNPGNILDFIWLSGNLCLGAAALHPTMNRLSQRFPARDRSGAPGRIAMLCAVSLVAPVMLLVEYARHQYRDIPPTALTCALLFALTISRLAGLVAGQRRLAITDALTGLYTRRFLEEHLTLEVARARRGGGQVAVFIADVDHFKTVNDCYGHPAGDRALAEIARRLKEAAAPGDILARYGGEEFALVVPDARPGELLSISERLRCRVASSPVMISPGTTVTVTVSVGAVIGPSESQSPEDLVAAADRALYRAKARGRDRVAVGDPGQPPPAERALVGHQTPMIDFLRHVADEVDSCLSAYEHSSAISRWATVLSASLGHDEATIWRLELAGRLHDIGKIVVPVSVLAKPSSLSDEEWQLLRQHPDHGSRLARLVPGFDLVAETIRQHHERFDGTGYPDRIAGTGIRLEARVIAVCDSWAAMRSDRAYQAALTVDQAREQLWSGRGTQFDPDLVDLFLDLHEQGLVGELARIGPPDGSGHDEFGPAVSARVFQKLIS